MFVEKHAQWRGHHCMTLVTLRAKGAAGRVAFAAAFV
jgi:hypothetical protein